MAHDDDWLEHFEAARANLKSRLMKGKRPMADLATDKKDDKKDDKQEHFTKCPGCDGTGLLEGRIHEPCAGSGKVLG